VFAPDREALHATVLRRSLRRRPGLFRRMDGPSAWSDSTKSGARCRKLYMLIIFPRRFFPPPSFLVCSYILLSIFGWHGIAAYVSKPSFSKTETLDYVRAARALGQSNPGKIMWRHIPAPTALLPSSP